MYSHTDALQVIVVIIDSGTDMPGST
jgi:hypothetical protein